MIRIASILISLAATTSTSKPAAASKPVATSQPAIVGTWKTDQVSSQIGPIITTYEFNADGWSRITVRQTEGEIPEISIRAAYELKGDVITFTESDGKKTQNRLKIDGDTMTLIQGSNKEDLSFRRLPRSTTQPELGTKN